MNNRAYREPSKIEELKNGLEKLVRKKQVLVFDDCQDYFGHLPSFLDILRIKNARFIAVSRYREKIEEAVKERRLTSNTILLGPMLNLSEIIEKNILKIALEEEKKELIDSILRISQGNPAIALMAIKHLEYLKESGRSLTLRGINDSFGLMKEILKDLIRAGEEAGSKGPKLFLGELAIRNGLREDDEALKENFEMVKKLKKMGHIISEQHGENQFYYIVPDMLRDHIIREAFFDADMINQEFKDLVLRMPEEDCVEAVRMLGIQFRVTNEKEIFKRGCAMILGRFKGMSSSPKIGFVAQQEKPRTELLIDLGCEAYDWFGDYNLINDILGDFCIGAERLENPYYVGRAGLFYYETGNLVRAEKCFNRVLELAKKTGDKYNEAASLHSLGIVQQDQGNYSEAEKLYKESLKIFEELKDKSGIVATLGQLGRLAEERGDHEEAVKNYLLAFEIFKELKITLHESCR